MLIGIDASRITKEERTGTENYSYNLIRSLGEVDKKNHYVLYFNKTPQFFEIGHPNFSSRSIPSPRLWTQGRLAFECLIRPPGLLFVPAHTLPVVHRPRLKTVVTVHDLGAEFLAEYHRFPQKIYLNWSTKYIASAATHLIAVSKSTKRDLKNIFNVSDNRVSVVYEGIDKQKFRPKSNQEVARIKLKYGIRGKYILYVGTIQPRKNLAALIDSFAKSGLRNVDLVIAGTKGWLYEEIIEKPKKLGIEEKVKFLDFVPDEDLPALYSGALFFAFPSLYEGFGLPILEAFACRCPVMTSKGGATEEVAGGAALLVNPKKEAEITQAIKQLSTDQSLRSSLIEMGSVRVEDFSWERCARETLKVFEMVYSGGKHDQEF